MYRTASVMAGIDCIVGCFEKLDKMNAIIPTSFDFDVFHKAVRTLMEYDHFLTLSKTLWMLYNILHQFNSKEKYTIIKMLLETNFY
jgi:hypothetical protein